jgi:hypothetical protein
VLPKVEEKMLTKKEKLNLIKGKTIKIPVSRCKLLPGDLVYHLDDNIEIKKDKDYYLIKLRKNIFYN